MRVTESERPLKGGTHCETMLYIGAHTLCTCEGHEVAIEVLCRSLSTLFCDTGSLSRPGTVSWPDWLSASLALGLRVCGPTPSVIVRVSVTVTTHHDQKQLGEARVLFSLQSVPHAEKAGQELKTGTGGRI